MKTTFVIKTDLFETEEIIEKILETKKKHPEVEPEVIFVCGNQLSVLISNAPSNGGAMV